MKLYAKQVPPEYQESPLFLGDFPDNIAVYGNRHYNEHFPDVFKRVYTALYSGELLEAWEDLNRDGGGYYYNWESALIMLVPPEGRGPYTREERKHKWPDIAWRYCNARQGSQAEDQALCDALELATGEAWETGALRGTCQGKWVQVCYPVKSWSPEALEAFETEYFNTGTEWMVSLPGAGMDERDGLDSFSCYCHGWKLEEIKKEIADAAGYPGATVILQRFTGYTQIPNYEEVEA